MFHPWRALRRLTSWDVVWAKIPGVLGLTIHETNTIHLNPEQLQVERRCTLTHELVHVERGAVPDDPWLAAREESKVEQIAALRLIELSALLDAAKWSHHHCEIADECWVDEATLQTRIHGLSPLEKAWLEERLD